MYVHIELALLHLYGQIKELRPMSNVPAYRHFQYHLFTRRSEKRKARLEIRISERTRSMIDFARMKLSRATASDADIILLACESLAAAMANEKWESIDFNFPEVPSEERY
jgi:hypothetical protein